VVETPQFPKVTAAQAAELIPERVPDREGWANDVLAALEAQKLYPAPHTVCSVLAVIEQESGFKTNPQVSGLAGIIEKQLLARAAKLGPLGTTAMKELLAKKAPGSAKTFAQRLKQVKTERDVDLLFRDILDAYEKTYPKTYLAANAASRLFTDRSFRETNPVTTAGSMQVSVQFAWKLKQSEKKRATSDEVRDELYTRQGGVRYGAARLWHYEAGYEQPYYRFADYNAGVYASRNAALQAQVAELTGVPLELDGDLDLYDANGEPTGEDSESLQGLFAFARGFAPDLSQKQIREDIRKEKSLDFESTPTYRAVKRVYQERTGKAPVYAKVPNLELKSPKLSKARSTAWFARSVNERFLRCMDEWEENHEPAEPLRKPKGEPDDPNDG
jgi:hypothetical protein